jgi:secreted protein with Ig-like and vWFA domain
MKYYYCIIVVWELLSDATGILLYYHGTTYNYQRRGNITVQYFNGSPGQAAVSSNRTSPLFSGGGGGCQIVIQEEGTYTYSLLYTTPWAPGRLHLCGVICI